MNSSCLAWLPKDTRKCKAERSDSIRSKGLAKDYEFNVRWLREARRVLKPDGTLWVTGTRHIIFSIGFALQKLGYRIIKVAPWKKSDGFSARQTFVATAFASGRTVITTTPSAPLLRTESNDDR
jgi:DNA modification methylase